eukprot:2672376-Amphidinium_carterae.1
MRCCHDCEGLDKSDYDVRDFYWTTGFVPTIARHNLFGFVTMVRCVACKRTRDTARESQADR